MNQFVSQAIKYRQTDRQTDGRTDGRTDIQTDRPRLITC